MTGAAWRQGAPPVVTVDDRNDALRIIEAATVLVALPGLMSATARDLAARRLRELSAEHPQSSELFAVVVRRLETQP